MVIGWPVPFLSPKFGRHHGVGRDEGGEVRVLAQGGGLFPKGGRRRPGKDWVLVTM